MKFLKELFNRFSLPTGSFFQRIQKLSILIGILSGLPLLIIQFESELSIHLPEWIHVISSKVAVACAAVAWIIAKLPLKPGMIDQPKVIQKLPFTDKKG